MEGFPSLIFCYKNKKSSNVYFSFRVLFLFLSEHQSICKFDKRMIQQNIKLWLRERLSNPPRMYSRKLHILHEDLVTWGKVDQGQLVLFILQISSSSSSKVNKIRGASLPFPRHLSFSGSDSFSNVEIHSVCNKWSEVSCCQLSETQLDSSHSPILSEPQWLLKDQNAGDREHIPFMSSS